MPAASQTHSLAAVCGIDRSCRAYWSLNPARKLLFFVHGFGGGAISTWRKFPELILGDDQWSGWDLFFYGYDSRRIRAGTSAQILTSQVTNVVEQAGYANPWLIQGRPTNFGYDEIWFIAHSLGAPLVRQMLVDEHERRAAWVNRSHLLCFAPASGGARIERMMRLLGTTGGGWMGIFHSVVRYRWTVLDDLGVGSDFLRRLLSGTVRASGGTPREPFESRLTLFGIYEDITDYPPAFPFDNRIQLVHGADHSSVCKPRSHDQAYFQLKSEIRP
jgi:pimeloyl-ACP methyl ester carboxylesterase